MIVAIHQPNYLPWLGYFAKIAQADIFVFLDDVQFSKNSYTNRVQILNGDQRRWLTVPVSVKFGDAIDEVIPAKSSWTNSHRDSLANFYRGMPAFRAVWPDIVDLYDGAPQGDIAAINVYLIKTVAGYLDLPIKPVLSSALDTGSATGDARLARIVDEVAPSGTYLSGTGGQNYQTEATFEARDISLRFSRFEHPIYEQEHGEFESGLSVLDVVFRQGWSAARDLIMASIK